MMFHGHDFELVVGVPPACLYKLTIEACITYSVWAYVCQLIHIRRERAWIKARYTYCEADPNRMTIEKRSAMSTGGP